jgi:hypothetical protein
MKEILERLLTENNEMIMESPLIGDDNYRSPSIAPPRLFHYLPKVYTKHCEKAVNMA